MLWDKHSRRVVHTESWDMVPLLHDINPRLVAKVDLAWMDQPHGREHLAHAEPLWFMTPDAHQP